AASTRHASDHRGPAVGWRSTSRRQAVTSAAGSSAKPASAWAASAASDPGPAPSALATYRSRSMGCTEPTLPTGTPDSPAGRPVLAHDAAAGHGLDVEGLVDLVFGEEAELEDDGAQVLAFRDRLLHHLGRLLVADVGVEGRGNRGRRQCVGPAALLVGLDAGHALVGQGP